jgi:hypothetical protein
MWKLVMGGENLIDTRACPRPFSSSIQILESAMSPLKLGFPTKLVFRVLRN